MFANAKAGSIQGRFAHLIAMRMILVGFLLAGTACSAIHQKDADPRQRVTDYISKTFAVREESDRQGLLDQLTGDARYRLAAWSDEQFRAAFIESRRTFVRLQFQEVKQVSEERYDVTYDLTYMDGGRPSQAAESSPKEHIAKVTQRKICLVSRDHGKWLINDVKSVKELVEYQGEMSLP